MAALRKVGVEVELYDPWQRTVDVDLVHVFGSEPTHAAMVDAIVAKGIPVVTTAMFVPIRKPWTYTVFQPVERFLPTTIIGLRRRLLEKSSAIIALTSWEKQSLSRLLWIEHDKISVLPNGVEERFYAARNDEFVTTYGLNDVVLCVGRVEPLKNQLQIAKAMQSTTLDTVFIGSAASRGCDADEQYLTEFSEVVNQSPNLTWLNGVDHNSTVLCSAYAAARVHVLASNAEAQGLVTFEAAAAGCNIVVSDLPTQREFFGTSVVYVNPRSQASIREGIRQAYQSPRGSMNPGRTNVLSWRQVGEKLASIYRKVIESGK